MGEFSALDRLDSPVDTMSTARSEKELEMPAVGVTAASLRSTVQNALKYVLLTLARLCERTDTLTHSLPHTGVTQACIHPFVVLHSCPQVVQV